MSAAAEQAVRAWANGRGELVGEGRPLSRGAFLQSQASPADGAYAVLGSMNPLVPQPVAEDSRISTVRISSTVYAGTQEAAENAATALRDAILSLRGCPVQVQVDSGGWVQVLVSDNVVGPLYVETPGSGGEPYAFNVAADFMLYAETGS